MKISTLLLVAFAAMTTIGCAQARTRLTPSANIITKNVNISTITAIDASRVKVIYTPGNLNRTVTISAPDNVMPHVEVAVHDHTLKCSIDNDVEINNRSGNCVTITVTAPAVEEFDASLSADIEIRGNVNVEEFSAEASTSGSVRARNVVCSESAEVDAGTSGTVELGTVNAPEIKLETTRSATVTVASVDTRRLKVECTTSGSVDILAGTAATANYTVTTSGSISAQAVTASRGTLEATTSGSLRCKVLQPDSTVQTTGGSISNN